MRNLVNIAIRMARNDHDRNQLDKIIHQQDPKKIRNTNLIYCLLNQIVKLVVIALPRRPSQVLDNARQYRK